MFVSQIPQIVDNVFWQGTFDAYLCLKLISKTSLIGLFWYWPQVLLGYGTRQYSQASRNTAPFYRLSSHIILSIPSKNIELAQIDLRIENYPI